MLPNTCALSVQLDHIRLLYRQNCDPSKCCSEYGFFCTALDHNKVMELNSILSLCSRNIQIYSDVCGGEISQRCEHKKNAFTCDHVK